jgi:DNA polymerase-3 subunit epsilon/ATP-dependent DNA helicase DinG
MNNSALIDFIALDLETTGLDYENDQIIEIAMVRFSAGQAKESYNSLVNPGTDIRPFISSLTGIQNSDLKNAPEFKDLALDVKAFIGDLPLVAHNAAFDSHFLKKAFQNIELEPLQNSFWDTLTLAKTAFYDLPNHRLENLCRFLNINPGQSHRALPDAKACGELLVLACNKLAGLNSDLLNQLINMTKGTTLESLFAVLPAFNPELVIEPFHSEIQISHNPNEEHVSQLLQKIKKGELVCWESNKESETNTLAEVALQKSKSDAGRVVLCLPVAKFNQLSSDFKQYIYSDPAQFICKRRYALHLKYASDLMSPDEREVFLPLVPWMAETTTGNINENTGFNAGRNRLLWKRLHSDPADYPGGTGSDAEQCFGIKHKRQALSQKLLIINHGFLMRNLKSDFSLLPDFNCLIAGDASLLIEQNFVYQGRLIRFFNLRNILRNLAHPRDPALGLLALSKRLAGASEEIQASLAALNLSAGEVERQLHRLFVKTGKSMQKSGHKASSYFIKESFTADLGLSPAPCLEAQESLVQSLEQFVANFGTLDSIALLCPDYNQVIRELKSFISDLKFLVNTPAETSIFRLDDYHNPHTLQLRSAPKNPGVLWRKALFPILQSGIFASEVLDSGQDFRYFKSLFGIQQKNHLLSSGSYSSKMTLPVDIEVLLNNSDEKSKESAEALNQAVASSVSNDKVPVLVLTTGFQSQKFLCQTLEQQLAGSGRSVLNAGGESSTDNLGDIFATEVAAVWVATDIPAFLKELNAQGRRLRVYIHKLPFPDQNSSEGATRAEIYKQDDLNAFNLWLFPELTLNLKKCLFLSTETIRCYDPRLLKAPWAKNLPQILGCNIVPAKLPEKS